MSPNQVEELFCLVTNAVSGIQRLEQGQSELKQDVSQLRQEFNEFRGETRGNFKEVKRELFSVNRRSDILNRDVLTV